MISHFKILAKRKINNNVNESVAALFLPAPPFFFNPLMLCLDRMIFLWSYADSCFVQLKSFSFFFFLPSWSFLA